MSRARCRGIMIAASGSGQGKTVFTAALARHHRHRGSTVKVIKLGPDFLDPMILEIASGQPVHNLDWWMMGEAQCRHLFHDAVQHNDVVLIESLMGLHDQSPSSAWLARELGLPVLLVMNLSKYAQTAAAVVHGMQHYAGGASVESVVGNRIGSERHHELVQAVMPDDVQYRGSLREHPAFAIPVRHLGLVQGGELAALTDQLDRAADHLVESGLALELPMLESDKPSLSFSTTARSLTRRTIAIARDHAFSFIYAANVQTLKDLGASCVFFSPLADEPLPPCDALWLPGGYPELHLEQLSVKGDTQRSIIEHVYAGKPGLAECGGMMYLGRSITTVAGEQWELCGVFDADFTMQRRFQSVGHQWMEPGSLLYPRSERDGHKNDRSGMHGQSVRGHSFHHSIVHTSVRAQACWQRRDNACGEALWMMHALTLTYVHHYFAQNPQRAASLFCGNVASQD